MTSTAPRSDVQPATAKPQGCTNFKLRRLMRQVAQHYDAELSQAGLKTTQYSLLSCVDRLGPIQPSDLARTMAMDASTLTRNLRPLVDAGWVLLGPGQNGRSRLVHITEAGHAKRQEAQRRWRKAQLGLNALLGESTVLALHALIDDSMLKFEAEASGSDEGVASQDVAPA
ncbi:MarR family winged helix-turn-helix transcriptional regulator [Curvibacter sp. RS43]|uniref:MarR family winged helix-turn-helix transcriptional regulator n=1 Tax=Curvibacter microcysteis TaxID=3026419 RepID=UPI00235DF347|nr:MarR family winged helix-turn-helix transcriptional regulator [Curvibacter sp. RS43]MDD0810144.1 MarR family winged helix-turn-helix transcriptional regulator [Curvibacter sp. RS43]